MGLFSPRRPKYEVRPEQKWDYISLKDFKSNSCFTPFAYSYLYISLGISIAVYGVDTFTAVNLLVFDQWSGSIKPTQLISFDVSKWIFSICIIASFVNLAFEHIRAWRIMRRGSVAESYLDSLAVRLESTRMGKGLGWRRFLVFAELTKSKKGAEYVALFTYFSFQSWIRIIFCSGPRQVVNAFTLYSVYQSTLIPADGGSVDRTLVNFFGKIETLAQEDYQQALILSGMLFTLIIWIFGALSLLLASLFYVFFLWHYIPRQDGGLSGYCERKINKRLMKIVSVKVSKAIAKLEEDRAKAEFRAARKNGEKPPVKQQATLPTIPVLMDEEKGDKLPEMPMLGRSDTMATLPPYTSRPETPGSIHEMNSFDQKRPLPSRQGTTNTTASYSSRAPLMSSAAGMGMERSASPAPSLPNLDLNNYPPVRPGTAQSQRGPTLPNIDMAYPPTRPGTAQSNKSFGPGQLQRVPTGDISGFGASYTQSPSTYQSETMPSMPPPVQTSMGTMDNYGRPVPRAVNQLSGRAGAQTRPMFDDGASNGRSSPAPSMFSNRGPPTNGPAYNGLAYAPTRSATNPPTSMPQGQQFAPQRNMTTPMPLRQQDDYFNPQRPGASNSQRGMPRPGYGYSNDLESQGGPRY